MPEEQPIYRGTIAELTQVDLESPLSAVPSRFCEHYVDAYNAAAKEASTRGDTATESTYRFLAVLVSFYPDFGDNLHPFRPMWQMEGRRSLVPEDLQPADLPPLRTIAERVHDSALRARLFDVLWVTENHHLDCDEAVKSYRESAEQLDTQQDWHATVTQYHRSLQLSMKLGRGKDGFQSATKSLINAIQRDPDNEDTNRTSQLMYVALQFGCGEPESLASIASKIGSRAAASNDQSRARNYWELEAEFKKAGKDENGSREAMRRVGESFVTDAQARAAGGKGSHLAAKNSLRLPRPALPRVCYGS